MHLYSLTLQPPGAVTAAVFGNFSAPRQQEVVVAKGHVLELLRPDETGKLHTILSRDAFGVVRTLLSFRLFGGDRDFLVVGSDSGRIAFLEFQPERGDFVQVHLESYGKSGCRRLTPGQYLASDPKGRAVMIAGIEKQKLVYVMNRTPTEKLTISSPLEAHKSHAIVYDICGLDVAFDNPVFAALEVDYAEADADATGAAAADVSKLLVYYELDLGLNNMTRKWSRATHRTANALIPVPGAEGGGPGGVLVCAGERAVTVGAPPARLREHPPPLLLLRPPPCAHQRTGWCMRARRRTPCTRPSRGARTCPTSAASCSRRTPPTSRHAH